MFYERTFRELALRKIKYLVIGGIAVNIHGYSRATGDLDIMISFEIENLKEFIGLVNALGFIPKIPVKIKELADPEKVESWKKEKRISGRRRNRQKRRPRTPPVNPDRRHEDCELSGHRKSPCRRWICEPWYRSQAHALG